MFRFVIRKMFSKKWMVLSLLIGNILLVSITAGNPMYTQAVLQRTLIKNMESYLTENNEYPGLISLELDEYTKEPALLEEFSGRVAAFPEIFGLDAVESVQQINIAAAEGFLDMQREDKEKVVVSINYLSDLEQHIEIVGGEMYSRTPDEEGVIEAIVSEGTMVKQDLLLGDVMTMNKVKDPEGNPIRLRITGVFRNSADDDRYWVMPPSKYENDCFIDPTLFESYFMNKATVDRGLFSNWYMLLDYTQMRGEDAEAILAAADVQRSAYKAEKVAKYKDSFSETLETYIKTSKKVNTTLWVLQVPIFMLLAAFIFMVSRQMLEMEYNEITVIKSRGAGRGQIFTIYLVQSLLISLIAYVVGIPLGVYLCQVVGSSNAFLEFVRRSALPVEINLQSLSYAAIASVLSICTMVLPAVQYSKTSIVGHKRRKNKKSDTPLWQKLGLDFIVLGVALYGLYSFNGQQEILAARVQEGASLDPLLFLSSSLFMLGAGLLAVRLLPVIVWLIYRPLRELWSPALYASFLRVLRTRSSQSFIMVFLIMTIALGVFNAQAARTINQNAEDNLSYSVGADVMLQEKWNSNEMAVARDPNLELTYYEPDYSRYTSLDGYESIAQVYVNENITATIGDGKLKDVRLMGIHTREFGETAWFKDSLSDIHWYNYLNAMSQNSRAVLVSSNFRDDYGCKLGDTFLYRNEEDELLRGVIYGFVDYFPGYLRTTYELDEDGLYKEVENYLIVAHLKQVQAAWGIAPYQIWFKNKDSSAYLYDFARENNITYEKFEDVSAQMVDKKNDPVMQGTNGILTVGFIVVLLLCSVGFLIYWILSIQSRSLQFGIFRAMGMSMREVISMLLNEQLFISGLSIVTGAVVGGLTSKLYMPLIQLAYAASDNAVPLEVISLQADNIRLFAVIGAVMLLCMVILGMLISRMKIAQALKLGED